MFLKLLGHYINAEDKGYAAKYFADGREIVKIGVVFSVEKRNIAEWKVG